MTLGRSVPFAVVRHSIFSQFSIVVWLGFFGSLVWLSAAYTLPGHRAVCVGHVNTFIIVAGSAKLLCETARKR